MRIEAPEPTARAPDRSRRRQGPEEAGRSARRKLEFLPPGATLIPGGGAERHDGDDQGGVRGMRASGLVLRCPRVPTEPARPVPDHTSPGTRSSATWRG
jgi:hypothetical protein